MGIEFTEQEEAVLEFMFKNFDDILELITHSKLDGYYEFTASDLYHLAEKLGIKYW